MVALIARASAPIADAPIVYRRTGNKAYAPSTAAGQNSLRGAVAPGSTSISKEVVPIVVS